MERQRLIDSILEDLSFMKSFFDEYSEEITFPQGEPITPLLEDMLQCLWDNRIPDSLFSRVKTLIDQLSINSLIEQYKYRNHKADFKVFEDALHRVVIGANFVEQTFSLLKAIDFVNSNIVLIGANGCGKTTFANTIREELERTETGIVLPAQKLLIFPTYAFLPTFKSAFDAYSKRQKDPLDDKQTFTAGKSDDIPYDITKRYGSELGILLSALLGERLAKRNQFCSDVSDGEIIDTSRFRSVLDEVIDIWNDLISHRHLFCDDSGNLQIRYDNTQYPAYKMSDGEREILYVVGRVLLAKENALIIVDEPELHLHKAILNKLWDRLELLRKDCMFIYLTHDIEFAASRTARKCWLKSYIPDAKDGWDIEPIEDGDIPEPMLLKLLGSRKKVLFCEGKKHSLDCQVYEILFPELTITPVESCKDVIDYTRAFNRIEKRYAEALGIIDADFRTDEQLKKLATESIYSFDVAEIENLFLTEEFIVRFADYKKEPCDISDIKTKIISLFEKNIEIQASLYVTQKINYQFKESHIKNGKSREEVIAFFKDFSSRILIDDWYNERMQVLHEIVTSQDYERAIRVYNNKGLHAIVEKALGLSSYNKKALEFLKSSDEAKTILKSIFPGIV